MLPSAPPMFSIMIGCPSFSLIRSAMIRPTKSPLVPAAPDMIMVIGRDGYGCADAGAAASRQAATATTNGIAHFENIGPSHRRALHTSTHACASAGVAGSIFTRYSEASLPTALYATNWRDFGTSRWQLRMKPYTICRALQKARDGRLWPDPEVPTAGPAGPPMEVDLPCRRSEWHG